MTSIVLLILALLFNLLMKGREGRPLVCLVVLIPVIAHVSFFSDVSSDNAFNYYGTAAAAGLVVFATLEFLPGTPLIAFMQLISITSIVVNIIGFAMWFFWLEPFWYNVMAKALMIIEFSRLMIRTRADGEYRAVTFMRSIRNDASGSNSYSGQK